MPRYTPGQPRDARQVPDLSVMGFPIYSRQDEEEGFWDSIGTFIDNTAMVGALETLDIADTVENSILPRAVEQLTPDQRVWFDGLGEDDTARWNVVNEAMSDNSVEVPDPLRQAVLQSANLFTRAEVAKDEYSWYHSIPAYVYANPGTVAAEILVEGAALALMTFPEPATTAAGAGILTAWRATQGANIARRFAQTTSTYYRGGVGLANRAGRVAAVEGVTGAAIGGGSSFIQHSQIESAKEKVGLEHDVVGNVAIEGLVSGGLGGLIGGGIAYRTDLKWRKKVLGNKVLTDPKVKEDIAELRSGAAHGIISKEEYDGAIRKITENVIVRTDEGVEQLRNAGLKVDVVDDGGGDRDKVRYAVSFDEGQRVTREQQDALANVAEFETQPKRVEEELTPAGVAGAVVRTQNGADLSPAESFAVERFRAQRREEGKTDEPTIDELLLPLDDEGREYVLETIREVSAGARDTETGQLATRLGQEASGERKVVGENVAGRRTVVYDFTHPNMAGARELGEEVLSQNRVEGGRYADGGNAWLDLYLAIKGQDSTSGGAWSGDATTISFLSESQARLLVDVHHFEREIGPARARVAVRDAETDPVNTPLQRMENMAQELRSAADEWNRKILGDPDWYSVEEVPNSDGLVLVYASRPDKNGNQAGTVYIRTNEANIEERRIIASVSGGSAGKQQLTKDPYREPHFQVRDETSREMRLPNSVGTIAHEFAEPVFSYFKIPPEQFAKGQEAGHLTPERHAIAETLPEAARNAAITVAKRIRQAREAGDLDALAVAKAPLTEERVAAERVVAIGREIDDIVAERTAIEKELKGITSEGEDGVLGAAGKTADSEVVKKREARLAELAKQEKELLAEQDSLSTKIGGEGFHKAVNSIMKELSKALDSTIRRMGLGAMALDRESIANFLRTNPDLAKEYLKLVDILYDKALFDPGDIDARWFVMKMVEDMTKGEEATKRVAQRIAAHMRVGEFHKALDNGYSELISLLESTRKDLYSTTERKKLARIVEVADNVGIDIKHLVTYKDGKPVNWKEGFFAGGGAHKLVDYIADKVGRNIRGALDVFRRDRFFDSAVIKALNMKDNAAAEKYIRETTERAYQEIEDALDGKPPTTDPNDPIRNLFRSIEAKMKKAGTNVAAIDRFLIPDALVDPQRIRAGGLSSWRQFIIDNPQLFVWDKVDIAIKIREGAELTRAQRDEFERYVLESYNYNAYGVLSRSALIAESNAQRLYMRSTDYEGWNKIFTAYGHKKDLGFHLASALNNAVHEAARETAINITLGAKGKAHASKLLDYVGGARVTSQFAHRRTRAMLETIANNKVRTNEYIPEINASIQRFLEEEQELPREKFYDEIEKRLNSHDKKAWWTRILFRDLWRPFTAAKLAAAPLLVVGDVLMRAEQSSEYSGLGVKFFSDVVKDLGMMTARSPGHILSKVTSAVTNDPIFIGKMYQKARAANQHLLGIIQAENSRFFASAQTGSASNAWTRTYENITMQSTMNELPFVHSKHLAHQRIIDYAGSDYDAMRRGEVSGDSAVNRAAAEFFQQFIAGKLSRREWNKIPKDGDLDALEKADYLTFLKVESVINEAAEQWSGKGTFRQEWTFTQPSWVGTWKGDVISAATVFTGYVNKMYETIARRWATNYRADLEMRGVSEDDGVTVFGRNLRSMTHTSGRAFAYGATAWVAMYFSLWGKESVLKNNPIDLRDENERQRFLSQVSAYSGSLLWVTDTFGAVAGVRDYERTSSAIGTVLQTRVPGAGMMWDVAAGALEILPLAYYAATDYNSKVGSEITGKVLRGAESAFPFNAIPFRAAANYTMSRRDRREKHKQRRWKDVITPKGALEFVGKRAADKPRKGRNKNPLQITDPRVWRNIHRQNRPKGVK